MVGDDTQLGRPPRHERAAKDSQLQRPARRRRAGPAVEVVCVGCGAVVTLQDPATEGPMGELLDRIHAAQASGELDTRCQECAQEHDRQEQDLERQAALVDVLSRRLKRSGVPERWQSMSFERLDVDEHRAGAIAAAREWGTGARRRGLLLWGPVGRGKTAIAAAAAMSRLAVGPLRWLSVAELLMDLRMPFDAPEYSRAVRALDPGRGVALVLDDLDKLKPTEHQLQPLYVAINGWVEAGAPLLVTMNREPLELVGWMGETFGEAIASRLRGYCQEFQLAGRDRRLT